MPAIPKALRMGSPLIARETVTGPSLIVKPSLCGESKRKSWANSVPAGRIARRGLDSVLEEKNCRREDRREGGFA